ncbi:MAG: nitroreductase family protein [Alphaproteobacteria bacterium]|nr:nitroreductase family protein [Alphaproteobacteria bacterium]
MAPSFTELLKKRRSIYNLGNRTTLPENEISALIKDAVKYTPSAFNSQSARIVILFDAQNQKLWQITREALAAVVPADKFAPTAQKIASFAAGSGSVLFFDDTLTVQELQEKFPLYRDNFPAWAEQANGMAQLAVWTALAEAGIGASLQHYNPLIDKAVKKEWQLPEGWKLIAQMPFGSIEAPAGEKSFLPIEERVLIKN